MENSSYRLSDSVEETEMVGRDLALAVQADESLPPFVALFGDLGVGKTAFVRGFASVFAKSSIVRSPTFAIVNEYPAKPRALFHFDMYRIDSEDDLISICYDDYLNRNGICLVEWSEKILYALPKNRIEVKIEKSDPDFPDRRSITIERIGNRK